MSRCDGVTATRCVTARWQHVQVLVLTTYDDDDLVFAALSSSAAGYLLKDVGSEALAEAVRAAARGESPLQPSIARKILQQLRAGRRLPLTPAQPGTLVEPLTPRELEILRLLGTGASNREIAARLSLTEGRVKNYVSTILAKTCLRDRTQAALLAVRLGLATTQ
jgi:DNA-binding NarL/FixJ family response regulator